ncbi:MAG: lipoprotein insertase outer membrane protein LolB [Pseudomonadota bacterium]|nr:lipoprotein insertase outer membrane protein LolB [Pseudomonadota bacterium]
MTRRFRAATAIALALVLAGCATTAPRAPLSPAARAAAMEQQQAREAALAARPDWTLAGRVALSNQGRGGSGRIDWEQRDAAFDVELSAPITRKGWRLSGDPGSALLEGLDGGPRIGADAAILLREATGWDIPVQALAHWVRGARAPGGQAQLAFDADGRLARLRQDGWTLEYADWQQQSDPAAPWLPMRVTAERDTARVRLVVDTWSVP